MGSTRSNVKPAKRVAIYARVSTDDQTTQHQRRALEEVAARSGWEVVAVYDDDGVSGAKGREYRKQFDRLLKDAARREFDIVAAWSVDRLGRSMQDLVGFLNELHALKIDLYLHQQGVDTTTPGGRAMFQMLGVFAEFERALIQERVKAGLARARAEGKTLGRRTGWRKEKRKNADEVRQLRDAGVSIRGIATTLTMSTSTVQTILKEARP